MNWLSGVYAAYLDEFSFIDKYTTETILTPNNYITASGLLGGIIASGELLQNISDNPKFLVLADIYVGEGAVPENINLFDARTRGGGIKETRQDDASNKQTEVMWYWDEAQNFPYPSATAFVVELPKSLLVEYGGKYTDNQLRPVIERHIQFGGYPAIRTYGKDPVLTSGTGWSGYIQLGWPSYGSDTMYNVHYSTLATSGFETDNETL